MLQLRPRERYAIGVLTIVITALVVYFGVVFPRDGDSIFPWSSDAWGHLVKAVYLSEQISDGQFYPDVFPSWYNGQQLLRYFPPLSYYAIVGIDAVTGNIFTAGNLFIFGASLIGGLSFLLFAPRIGHSWAVLAGILYIIFPDNIRVAFAEGNLPRLAAASLLPAAVYFLLKVLENPRSKRNLFGLTVMISLIVLSHAMMAGIFLVSLGLYAVTYWLVKGDRFKVVATAVGGLFAGMLISGWWLLPSLTGGLAELDNSEGSEAVAYFPPSIALNPSLRSSDIEIFYVGLSAILLVFVAMFMWKRLEPWMRAVLIVTFITTLIGSTFMIDVWRAVPGNELFWARRFLTVGGFGLVMTIAVVARQIYASGAVPERRWLRLAAVAVVILVFVDFQPSLQLIHTRERPERIQQISEQLAELDGWRVATADLSRLGSAPAMLFTTEGEREQVFGWAFQGSITGPLLARINQSFKDDFLEFAVSRLDRLGTDDVVIRPQSDISPDLGEALEADGFQFVSNTGGLFLYHRDGAPRAFTIPMKVLGIGGGAENASRVFPQMTVGSSSNFDDYTDEFLTQFDLVLLSRFTTSSRGNTESRVERLAEGGMRFVVDLTGAPVSPLSRQPKFLDVYGEPVLQIEQATLIRDDQRTRLLPFDTEINAWNSVSPQGAQETLVRFDYPAAEGVAIGRNVYGEGEVIFLGLNLLFHASSADDPHAISLLEEILELPALTEPDDIAYPLSKYEAGEDGWTFEIDLPEAGWVLFPMAHYEGTRVYANGEKIESTGIERLTFARMPAGVSSVEIRSERTGIYTAGNIASVLGLLLLASFLLGVGPQKLFGPIGHARKRLRGLRGRPTGLNTGEEPMTQS